MSPNELLNLEAFKVQSLWECITMIEAQEQLKAFTVQDWSHMKKAQRTKLHKDLFKQAYPSEIRKKNYISPEELLKVLGR